MNIYLSLTWGQFLGRICMDIYISLTQLESVTSTQGPPPPPLATDCWSSPLLTSSWRYVQLHGQCPFQFKFGLCSLLAHCDMNMGRQPIMTP
jgi:hypothetical protein